ncbi:MAG: lytic transglycosylase domain-containing protein [Acidiferrobacteraceae bacterium]|jgi:soluble lytic murein transglycosylase-like protein
MRINRAIIVLGLVLYATTAFSAESDARKADPELTRALRAAAQDTRSFHDPYLATVWLTDMSNRLRKRIPDPDYRIKLLTLVHREALRAELPPELVLAVIEVESNFDQFAISRAGARGLMQVMPFWLKEIGKKGDNLFRMKTNLRYGCTILKYYMKKEDGNLVRALGRYNGSTGRWRYPGKIFNALDRRWYPN